jgi:DNA-binding transcriptional LysR family regulator
MDLRGVDLNLLLAFEALAAARSVTEAAQAMGVRQPAMSGALARLRTLFGDPLWVRAGGGLRPTAKAGRLAPRVAAALAAIRAALGEEAAFDPAATQRVFTLALTDYASAVVGPTLLARLRADAPGVDLRVIGYQKGEVGELIARGAADLALGVFANPPEGCVVTPVAQDRFIGLARRGHPALDGALTVEAWAALDHALVTLSRDARGAVDAALGQRGLSRRVALTLPHFLALPAILPATDLVAAVPARLAERICGDTLTLFELPIEFPAWRLEMLWSPLARADSSAAWLRASVAAAAREN